MICLCFFKNFLSSVTEYTNHCLMQSKASELKFSDLEIHVIMKVFNSKIKKGSSQVFIFVKELSVELLLYNHILDSHQKP